VRHSIIVLTIAIVMASIVVFNVSLYRQQAQKERVANVISIVVDGLEKFDAHLQDNDEQISRMNDEIKALKEHIEEAGE
jgi:TolA-binding protein